MIASRRTITREAVASHYDELDHFYRDVWGEHVHHGLWLRGNETRDEAVLQLADRVGREAQVGPGVRVCDIGCGYGATARFFARRGADVSGITVSPAQYGIAANLHRGARNPRFLLGDWLKNDFESESFDAAIAIESSEHMPDKAQFFDQAQRVLRPGGRLVICAWLSAENPSRRAKDWLLEPICREGRMPHMGSASEYQALAEAAGFELKGFDDVTRQVQQTWPAIVRRVLLKLVTNRRYVQFLLSRNARNRVFTLTILRILIAYRVGAMRYGIFTFVKR